MKLEADDTIAQINEAGTGILEDDTILPLQVRQQQHSLWMLKPLLAFVEAVEIGGVSVLRVVKTSYRGR